MSAQRTVNARKLAANRSELQGSVEIQTLTGVHDRLAGTDGELSYQLAFHPTMDDQEPLVVVDVDLQTDVTLTCQRSLQPFQHRVKTKSQVVLVVDESQAEQLAEDYEPFACKDLELDINALLIEELLLALPLVPVNPEAEELQSTDEQHIEAGEQDQNPFAGLAALKKDLADKD